MCRSICSLNTSVFIGRCLVVILYVVLTIINNYQLLWKPFCILYLSHQSIFIIRKSCCSKELNLSFVIDHYYSSLIIDHNYLYGKNWYFLIYFIYIIIGISIYINEYYIEFRSRSDSLSRKLWWWWWWCYKYELSSTS